MDITGAVSPNGRFLTYTDWSTGELAMHNLDTHENRYLTQKGSWIESDEFALFSTISPESKQIAYAWFNEDGFFDLRIIGLDASEPHILYSNKGIYPVPMHWSQDSKYILALFSRQIVLVSTGDGAVRVIKNLGWRSPQKMNFSPDGRYIVYDLPTSEDSPTRDIYIIPINGGREIPLVQHPANDLLLGWSPDGDFVLFASDRTGNVDAWSIQVSNGKPQGFPVLEEQGIGPNIVALGFTLESKYYYGVLIDETDLCLVELGSKTGKFQTPLTKITSVGTNTVPDWSPSGRYMAYVVNSGAAPWDLYSASVVIRTIETGEERRLSPKIRQWHKFVLDWSPDESSLLVQARGPKNTEGVYRVDLQTGEVFTLVQSEDGCPVDCCEWPSWIDSENIVYTRWLVGSSGYRKIVSREVNTGHEKELYRTERPYDVSKLTVSCDGKLLAFILSDEETGTTAIKVMSATGGEDSELLRLQPPETISQIAWMPDNQNLLFGRIGFPGEKQIFELWRISAEGGKPQNLGLTMKGVQLYGLSVHPDGRRIAFTAGQPDRREIWVMENFLPKS